MEDETKWIIGVFTTIHLAVVGWIWKVNNALHTRINRVRETYVRRDDLDGHIQRLESEMKQLRADQKEASKSVSNQLDRLFDMLTHQRSER